MSRLAMLVVTCIFLAGSAGAAEFKFIPEEEPSDVVLNMIAMNCLEQRNTATQDKPGALEFTCEHGTWDKHSKGKVAAKYSATTMDDLGVRLAVDVTATELSEVRVMHTLERICRNEGGTINQVTVAPYGLSCRLGEKSGMFEALSRTLADGTVKVFVSGILSREAVLALEGSLHIFEKDVVDKDTEFLHYLEESMLHMKELFYQAWGDKYYLQDSE